MEIDDQPLKMVYTGNYPRISWQSLSLICHHQTYVCYYHCKFRGKFQQTQLFVGILHESYNFKPVKNYTKPNE